MDDEGLESLIDILTAMEQWMTIPTAAAPILMVFLPKPDGGNRPIGLFNAMARVDEGAPQ